ncbi:MAG: hypothetical protein DIZ77_13110 [endosymbiont of Seepiophila jonesi]|uniref:Uncharacterized protein n=1 Tax=endosymbiont of Lamellibrachia luymesi TaxID=2200907 RepID=A0A370DM24_9GAMM|nr:MAG: hypothetical protein DIZ79_17000 [endosymbiont of Lamellibrachia luymesi]RDH90544.1 MAG: hypothetical protein DIZ77_13110 [endosymbiont of Seepiophila jonesi]
MEMGIQIECSAEALDQGDSTTGRAGIVAGLSYDRILASWWFGVRLAEGWGDCLSGRRTGVNPDSGTPFGWRLF